ncbi:adipokinetic hormone 2 precursor [Tribolium castaneum]|uniref:AKH-II preprohormone n=1 Tax=Tribolium castaneum TaxID=7070 RepID=A3RE77_TRICA|nr:adipokinetic hormone 2 precursor [Tribolium castaneum]ABB58740.1 AKH-II preprohormone [Tribolium castaneum]ABN79649.1 adipokinetic hormone 2 [Tribolium castaneum]EFA04704.2 adipokinetic hormone 2 [Tribolium castaneum]|eukprot:NP_001107818.1 adipokinetic hormone 2 precursor [Tribolium castaneum]
MHRVLLTVLLITIVGLCAAQLNFTPNWGKRAPEGESNRCKESVDTIMLIYKIIQNEAQKLVDCEKFSN